MRLPQLIIFLTIAQAEEGIGHVEPVKVVAEEIGYGFIGGVSAISSVPTRYRVSALAVLGVGGLGPRSRASRFVHLAHAPDGPAHCWERLPGALPYAR